MKNLIKLVFLAAIFQQYGHTTVPSARTIVNEIVDLTKNDVGKLCQMGIGSYIRSLRSDSGAYCVGKLRASVARIVCGGEGGFNLTHCGEETAKAQIHFSSDAEAFLLDPLENDFENLTKVCDVITEILPDKKPDCDRILRQSPYKEQAKIPKVTKELIEEIIKNIDFSPFRMEEGSEYFKTMLYDELLTYLPKISKDAKRDVIDAKLDKILNKFGLSSDSWDLSVSQTRLKAEDSKRKK